MKKAIILSCILNIFSILSHAQSDTNPPDTYMIDGDGNTYIAKWFGTSPKDGAYWTTSNLWSTRDGNGKPFNGDLLLNEGKIDQTPLSIKTSGLSTKLADNITYIEGKNKVAYTTTLSQKDYAKKFGLMYTWLQASQVCPKGWHLPTEADWENLINASGGQEEAGGVMRGNSTYYYKSDTKTYRWGEEEVPNTNGFNGLPAGHIRSKGTQALGGVSVWWSDTNGTIYGQSYRDNQIYTSKDAYNVACSVRCVKD